MGGIKLAKNVAFRHLSDTSAPTPPEYRTRPECHNYSNAAVLSSQVKRHPYNDRTDHPTASQSAFQSHQPPAPTGRNSIRWHSPLFSFSLAAIAEAHG
jgi:hypothetical protein